MFTYAEVGTLGGMPWFNGEVDCVFGRSVPDNSGDETGLTAGWFWDGETLEIRSDRHGYLPLYYMHDESTGGLTVSDSPLHILMSVGDPEYDESSLAFFCRAGFLLGDRTLYKGISRVPAGCVIRWCAGKITVEQVEAQFDDCAPSSIEDAVDGWIDRFVTAMARRKPIHGDFAMPLSGGRDSRMMLMELRNLGFTPSEVVTLAPGTRSSNDDVRIAMQIAEQFNLNKNIVRSTRGWFDLELERHAWCGAESLEHSWLIPLWSYMASNHSCWYDGLGAGSMTRNSVNTPEMHAHLMNGRIDAWCDSLFADTAAPSQGWVDRIQRIAPMNIPGKEAAVEYAREEISRHLDAPNPSTRFTFCNWGRRGIALSPFGICRGVDQLHTPFMDRDLVNWCASIPAEWTFVNDIQSEACMRLYPEVSAIPFNGTATRSRSYSGVRQRVSSWIDKNRFFAGSGKVFQTIASDAMRSMRQDASANRALGLMAHLVMTEACRDTERARHLIGCAPSRHLVGRTVEESVA